MISQWSGYERRASTQCGDCFQNKIGWVWLVRPYHPLLYRACKGYSEKLSRGPQCLLLAVPCLWTFTIDTSSPAIPSSLSLTQSILRARLVLPSLLCYRLVRRDLDRAYTSSLGPTVDPSSTSRILLSCLSRCYNCPGSPWFFRGGRITTHAQTSAWRAYIMFESASECEGDTPSCRSCRRVQTDLWPCYQPFY